MVGHTTQVERASGVVVGRRSGVGNGGLAEQLREGRHGSVLRVERVHGGALPVVLQRRSRIIAALLGWGNLVMQLHDGRVGLGHVDPRGALRHVGEGVQRRH
jgi:hypothetical protein